MEYPTREGTDNPGFEYEKEIAALLAVRYAFEKSVQDFWIATNVGCVGDTDDVVLCITPVKGEQIGFLLQLKHENPTGDANKFEDSDFTHLMKHKKRDKRKEKFSLDKYFKGYTDFQNHLKNIENVEKQPVFNEFLSKINKFAYVLYTNRGLEKELKCLVNVSPNVIFNHLNTSKSTFYGFRPEYFDYLDPDFIQNLYLFPNQINFEGVFNLIKAEIRKLFGSHKFEQVNFDDVTKKYLEIIKLWTKGCEFEKDTKYITLSKENVINILSDILLDSYKCDFEENRFSHYDCPQKNIWNKLMSHKDVSIVYGDETTIQFLKDYIGTEVKLITKKQGRYWKTEVAKSASNAFFESVPDHQVQTMKICSNNINDCITMASIYKHMWFYKKLPLLLEINSEEEYNDIFKILRLSEFKLKVIVIVNDQDLVCGKWSRVNHFSSLQDLEPSDKLDILNVPVQFQGRISLPLAEIAKVDMLQNLKCADIIHILCNDFNVGNKVNFNCKGYINRSVFKILISLEVLVEIENEFFLIEVQNIKECEKILTDQLHFFGFSVNNHANICLLESNGIPEKFEELQMKHDCIHRLLFHEDYFEWQESTGSIQNIAMFQIYDKYSSFYDDVSNFISTGNKFQIISACPGMGKSVLLDYVSCFSNSCAWILSITLRSIAESCEMEDDQSEFFTYYMDELLSEDSSVQNLEFSLMVFKDMLKTKKILILLDGFDEVAILYKDKFSYLIEYFREEEYPVIITTRENMTNFLETTFNVLSRNLKPLTLDEQKQFLTNFFKTNIKVKNENSNVILLDFVEQLLNAAKHNLNDRDEEFTGVPLQLNLLACNFLKECKTSISAKKVCLTTKFDLLDLYEKFIKNKTSILCEKFGASEKQWLKSLESNQYLFALQHLFHEFQLRELNIENCLQPYYENEEYMAQLMQKEGILIAKSVKDKINIDFVHRTFAEYLAAQWLTKNVKSAKLKSTLDGLVQMRFEGHYKFLFVVFDRILAKTCPFHLDIINGKVDDIKLKLDLNPNIFVETDEINRTAFHMFGLYAGDYTEEDLIEILDTNKLKNLNVDTLDNLTSYSPLDFALLSHFMIYANIICELSRYLRMKSYDISYTGIKDQCLKFKFLFFTVFHNYICRELLIGELYQDIQIFDYTNDLINRIGLPRDIFEFVKSLCTIGDYLKFCGIKDAKKYYYHDIRFAIAFGSKKNVEDLLLTKEVNINEVDSCNDCTLLCYATIYKRPDVITMLLNKGADVNIPGRDKSTVVHYSARDRSSKILEIYINKNANLNTQDGSHHTPLDIAIDSKQGHVALTLLKHGVEFSNSYYNLHDIVELGNAELLKEFLKKDFDINLKLINNMTPLHTALKKNYVDLAKILISHNCDIKQDNAPDSLIHLAAKTGNLELLNLFLDSGLNINKENELGKTPLMIAVEHGHVELVNSLIFNKADVLAGGVFFTAVLEGNEEIISRLIETGCDVNSPDDHGNTPLLIALEENNLSIVKLLLQQHPDINVQNDFGYTTLHYAAMNGYHDLVDQFLNCGVDINQTTNDSNTALLLALKDGFIEVAKLLLLKGAKVDVVNKEMCNCLHYAVRLGNIILVQDLISAGAELDLENNCGHTPLDLAILNNKSDIAKLLLSYDVVDVALKLHIAAAAGNDDVIMLCLEKGMNINEKDPRGMTPISCAFELKRFKTAKLLIDNGADMKTARSSYDSGLHYAARIGFDDLVIAYLTEGFDINEKNSLEDPPLIIALLNGNLSTAKLLHCKGAELNIKRVDRSTTLHMAAFCGYTELIMDCIDKGHDINCANFDCNLPIDFAIMENRFEAAKLLIESGTIPTMETLSLYVDIDVRSEIQVDEKIKFFKLLLDNFGNINLKDKDGNTILHYICYSDFIKVDDDEFNCGKRFYREAVDFLLHLGADFTTNNKDYQSAYDLAVKRNLEDILMIFDQSIKFDQVMAISCLSI